MDKEINVTNTLLGLLEKTGLFQRVVRGESLKKSGFKGILEWYGSELPYIFITPDLVLVFENATKVPDEAFLVAIEIKYLSSKAGEDKKYWRKVFREIGQPLRNLIFGFDLVVLWHLFSDSIDDEKIKKFSDICKEVIDGLRLPVTYFATKISEEGFRIYSPWDLNGHQNMAYIANCLKKFVLETKEEQRNPLLKNSTVIQRRKGIKSSLNIP